MLTIHNMGYQGWFARDQFPRTGLPWDSGALPSLEMHGQLNLLKAGIVHSTMVSTVSPRYASEIQSAEGGEGLDGLLRSRGNDVVGVLNGIDERTWNPEIDRHISGQQLCLGLRDFAIQQYGYLAPLVLGHWNVHRTDDFGRIVFLLVDLGMMSKRPTDHIDDFRAVYDFGEAFGESELLSQIVSAA